MKYVAFRFLFLFVFAVSLFMSGVPAYAEPKPSDQPSPPKPAPAAVDGVVKDGEYPLFFDLAPFKVWVSRSGDVIRFAVSAETRGWVALGFGSRRMDGADIFMGEVKNGKEIFTEQIGRGHGHADNPAGKRFATRYAVKLDGDVTTMELECPAAKVVPKGAKELPVILAYSASDSLTQYHTARRSATLKLE
ncbi:MAG: hypothetical protein JXD23_07460 [Spirochaetales bacterium]|nr:hypothetical protein [Spirochaetales bacterium]